jgi:hypothetical protein
MCIQRITHTHIRNNRLPGVINITTLHFLHCFLHGGARKLGLTERLIAIDLHRSELRNELSASLTGHTSQSSTDKQLRTVFSLNVAS